MASVRKASGLLLRILVALGAALLVVVLAVLPAEYGYDPTGVGESLGLTGLATPPLAAMIVQESELASDAVAFELLPFESLEYKYRLEEAAAMVFSWRASGAVVFDLHAEPDAAEPGYAESFGKGSSTGRSGSYVAPFSGIHGWFWENRGQERVVVTLTSKGFFTAATLFRDGAVYPRPLLAVPGDPETVR